MALGVFIRGFRGTCRPVICVDGSHLKHNFGKHMITVIALDANNQLHPMALAMVYSENNNSLMYFIVKLKEAIRKVENLVFISNQHKSIAHALSIVFPEAHHGVCTYHVKMNINHKFQTNHCDKAYELVAQLYQIFYFNHHFDKIKIKDPAIAKYLEEIGV